MKSKTHIYMANLIASDLKKFGKLTLPGIGSYAPPANVIDAINSYPAAFRAGAVGPDFYPDLLFGQTIIHGENSGDWLTRLFNEYGRLPDSYPEKKKCYAFILGFMMHYAGDMYGHHYVNTWAKGWWQYSLDAEKMKIVARHFLIETFMDRQVPENIDTELDAPIDFLHDVFFSTELKDTYSKLPFMPISLMVQLKSVIESARNNNTAGTVDIANYFPGWLEHIRNGSKDWLIVWQEIAEILSDESRSVLDVKKVIETWGEKHLELMLGLPKWAEKFPELDILLPLKEKLKEAIKTEVLNYLSSVIHSITDKQANNLDEALEILKHIVTEPAFYLNNGILYPSEYNISAKLKFEMGNYGGSDDTLKQTFQAFYQCLNMCKLCLIGPENLNELIKKHTSNYITIKIKTASNSIFQPFCGTDDDVYFALIMKDGSEFETKLDTSFHNDFESGQLDSFDYYLPQNIKLTNVVKLRLRKNNSDDWKPEWLELYDKTGIKVFYALINAVLKEKEPYYIDVKNPIRDNTIEIDATNKNLAIRLKAANGRYVTAEGGKVVANSQNADIWETFDVNDQNRGRLISGDTIYLSANNGNYLSVDGDKVVVDNAAPTTHEFVIQKVLGTGEIQNGDKVTLRFNDRYVAVEADGRCKVAADKKCVASRETFTVEFADIFFVLAETGWSAQNLDPMLPWLKNLPAPAPIKYVAGYYQRGIRHIKIDIRTTKNEPWFNKGPSTCGTDDNVYFAVTMKDGSTFETLLDQAYHDDFQNDQLGTYIFDLPQTILLSDIANFKLRKDYLAVDDDWQPEWIKLYDESGQKFFEKDIKKMLKGRELYEMQANLPSFSNNIVSIDPKIISFLYSLDGKGHSDENPTSELPWKIGMFPFYAIPSLRSTIYARLFENPCIDNLISIRLKTSNGQYVHAESEGGAVVADSQNASIWETFIVNSQNQGKLMSGNVICLSTYSGNYLCAEGGGGREVVANRSTPAEWERFVIEKIQGSGQIKNGDKVTLRSVNRMYISAENVRKVFANRQKAGIAETFTVEFAETLIPPFEKPNEYSKLTSWVGFEYDPEQAIFYSKVDAWQRKLGYFPIYDAAAPLAGMFIHCEPIRFEYNGKRWNIELWKGQYGISTGAEIGIYVGEFQLYKTFGDRIKFLDSLIDFGKDTACADNENMLQMSYELRKNGDLVFRRNSDTPDTADIEKHWWLTGFKPGMFASASELQMDIAFVFKDVKMADAFVGALAKMQYQGVTRDACNVSFSFNMPHSLQPWT